MKTEDSEVRTRASTLVSESLVWDGIISWSSMDLEGAPEDAKKVAVDDYRRAGVNVADLTIAGDYGSSYQRTLGWISSQRRYFAQHHAHDCLLVEKLEDIELAQRTDRLAILFHFQGGSPFLHYEAESPVDLNLVEFYFNLGVRRASLALNYRNALADGCFEPGDAGLSLFGRRTLAEMNRVGMVVDCTHTGRRSTLDAIDMSSKPVVFSHSNPCGVFDHPRNITDEQIRACASRDGVVGIVGWAPIVNRENDASPEAVLEHVLYVSELVGPRHVAIGLDYVYDPGLTTRRVKAHPEIYTPDGGTFEDWNYHHELQEFAAPSIFVPLTELLLDRGFTDDEVRGILGQNWHRVLRANWAE